jgi:hypothetical protein
MKRHLIVVLLIITLLLTACQAIKKTDNTTADTTQTSQNSQIGQADTIPAQLDNIESAAEDIIDNIANSDWTGAQDKLAVIKTNFGELKTVLVSAAVSTDIINGLETAINGLETAAGAQKSYDARVQANQISRYVPDIMDYYTVAIPTDVGRLDYLGREIILNVENADWPSAGSNFDTANNLWNSLKSKLGNNYKNDIDIFQSNMDDLKAAIDKLDISATTDQANALLENVDVLENDFTNRNKG